MAKRLTDRFHVVALVPSAPGAASREILDGVEVIRYRYAPRRFETLVNDGGIVNNLRRNRWKIFLVPTFVLAQAWRTWRLLRSRKVDVIHAHWLLPQGLIVALLRQLSRRVPPFLVTSHGADLFALRGRGLNVLKRFVVRRAASVTVVSEAMRDELARIGADVGAVDVQPMGVDLTARFIPDIATERSRDEILFVGRLVEKKGLRYLIDAMPEILKLHPAAYLTVAGFGPEDMERQAQVRSLDLQSKVCFVGAISQSELPVLYRRAAVFVAPFVQTPGGDQEGLGLVTVEAAGCGCAVVMSDLPTTRDIFNGGRVHLTVPRSAKSIADSVCSVLSRVTIGDEVEARDALYEKFDWSAVAENYGEILFGLVDGGER
ncbi:glycosyltransferase [Rhodanobacter sp. FDAARGOS 1247]|uniref:glycosyltransferase n=1 Tax=Rhodanobacter sp. FDAARGOS 1247 TaxID=2778082 RepID=UPI001EF63C69|nr:glycosyltransferase [Rhodanobacter sp. FDAARGOS 1247]